MKTDNFKVKYMKCDGCVGKVRSTLSKFAGVLSVDIDLNNSDVTVKYESDHDLHKDFADALKLAGYPMDE
ncbi:MAG: heavy metal-associated domain-containing protein [Bacteroidia bacterium]|nr:heavy metal-associated domain-containing protein [Bacteroidia bacterium]